MSLLSASITRGIGSLRNLLQSLYDNRVSRKGFRTQPSRPKDISSHFQSGENHELCSFEGAADRKLLPLPGRGPGSKDVISKLSHTTYNDGMARNDSFEEDNHTHIIDASDTPMGGDLCNLQQRQSFDSDSLEEFSDR